MWTVTRFPVDGDANGDDGGDPHMTWPHFWSQPPTGSLSTAGVAMASASIGIVLPPGDGTAV